MDVEFAHAFVEVTWQCEPGVEQRAAALSPLAAETLYFAAREAVRNAVKYAAGHPASPYLHVEARSSDGQLQLVIEDNGPAIRAGGDDALSKDRAPGSTGQGLDLHTTLMAIVGGSLSLVTIPGQATRVQLYLPIGGAVYLGATYLLRSAELEQARRWARRGRSAIGD